MWVGTWLCPSSPVLSFGGAQRESVGVKVGKAQGICELPQ